MQPLRSDEATILISYARKPLWMIPALYQNDPNSVEFGDFGFILLPAALFLRGHLKAAGRRLFKDYFIRDFNLGSPGLLLGAPMVMFGLIFGVKTWITSLLGPVVATSGTVMLGALPILLGMQFLVLFF